MSARAGARDEAATDAVLALIAEMEADVAAGPPIYRPSRFWVELSELNKRQLAEHGFAEFKRTVNQNYFQFMPLPLSDAQWGPVIRDLVQRPDAAVFAARLADDAPIGSGGRAVSFPRIRRLLYPIFVALLWRTAAAHDRLGILPTLSEPELGHPVVVRYGGRRITQDVANCALELSALTRDGDLPLPSSLLELGGGYGRLGWAYLEARPDGRYIAVDIAPALAVAQQYLTSVYPHLPTFRFRRFDRADDALDELRAARLAFLTPGQLELLPALEVDAFVNISSLQEMRRDQIERYLQLVDVHCAGRFYTKQWQRSVNRADGIVLRQSDYPIPERWRRLMSRQPYVQRTFFEELYLTRPS